MPGFEDIELNLHVALAVFGRANPSGESEKLEGVSVTSSAVQFSMFNSAALTAPVATVRELEARVHSARKFFSARRLAWSFWVCLEWLKSSVRDALVEVFARNGLHQVVTLPGMESERLAPPAHPPVTLGIRRVEDAQTRADFSRIMSGAFGIPSHVARAIYESERLWDGDFSGHVGYLGNLPVTSTATIITGPVVGVYAVGTLPTHMRKGYAETIMRHALDQVRAATGIERSVLQSSDAGLSLYRTMGYRPVARYAVFGT